MSKFAINPPPTESVDLSEAARRVHLNEFLVKAPDPGAIWVFAAGSLIWKPGFDPADIPSPIQGKELFSSHGRGIYLINELMDDVSYALEITFAILQLFAAVL